MYGKFKKLLEERGVTAYQVAKSVGIPISSIYEWANGKHAPRVESLMKLADYFGVPLEYFVKE